MATKYDGYYGKTGLNEDVINEITDRGIDYCLFNKGKLSPEEFSKKISKPFTSYSNMLNQRFANLAEFREAMEKAKPRARQITNEIISEYDSLPKWIKFHRYALVHYEKKLRKAIAGERVFLLKNVSKRHSLANLIKPHPNSIIA